MENCVHKYLKVTNFLWVLIFDISADWPKNVNISYKHYSSIEHYNLSALYHFRIQIAKFNTYKTCFRPKSQKNVPAIIVTLR